MYKKARFIVKSKHYTKNKKRISNKNLYMLYSQKGAHQGNGNFLTYVQRSEKIFGKHDKISRGCLLYTSNQYQTDYIKWLRVHEMVPPSESTCLS